VLPGETDWRPVCRAPCDISVRVDALYRVTGAGIQASKVVQLAAADGDEVLLDVDPTTEATHVGGEALIIGGGVALVTGGILLYVDALTAGICSDGTCSSSNGVLWVGVGAAAVGAVAVIAGVRMAQPTSLEQSTGAREEPPLRAARNDKWLRTPMWRDVASESNALPRPTSLPLLSGTF
jgi:hypothetical protein